MNQLYAEAGVKRKDDAKTMGLRVLLFLGIALGAIILLVGGAFGIVGVIVAVVMIYLLPRLNVEYEYVFVDGQLDFDRISGQAKRKTLLRIDFEQVEIMAPHHSHSLDSYRNMDCIKKDFSSGTQNNNTYAIAANVDGKKYLIYFEPNEMMLNMIKQKSPRKVTNF